MALTLSPLLWSVLAAAVLGLLGIVVGRATGRLAHLFGAVGVPPVPHPFPARQPAAPDTPASNTPASNTPASSTNGPVRAFPSRESLGRDSPVPEVEDETVDEGPPPACCPHCRAELAFVRTLPFVAARAFRRRGACPHCEQRIRPHLAVVITTALLFALVGALLPWHLLHWSPLGLLAVLWLVALGTVLSVIDLRVMRLPDVIVAPAYPVAVLLLAAAVLLPPAGPDLHRGAQALGGMVLVTVLYWSLWRVRPGGLGFGDVKLSGLTGLYAGWAAGVSGALVAVFWAFAAFSLVGLALMALRRVTRAEPLPLGPFMLAATLATVLTGQPLIP